MDSVSASSALGASAVTPISPVQAGRPVAGSSRWCAKPPCASRQTRTFKPEVATPPAPTRTRADRLAGERVLDLDLIGLELRADAADREVAAAVDDEARVAGAGGARRRRRTVPCRCRRCRSRRPRGRRTVPSRSSTDTRRQSCSGCGRAGRRGGAAASACSSDAGWHAVERARVAGALERARRASDRPARRCARAAQIPARTAVRSSGEAGTLRARVAVERAQLAVGAKARQARGEVLDVRALAPRGRGRRRARRAAAADRSAGARRCPSSGR